MRYCRAVTTRVQQTDLDAWPEPLVRQVLDWALAAGRRMPVLAVAGPQGSGKSTLARQLVVHARGRGLTALALSLDDFYLLRSERIRLARRLHPLLATRGPPGSHDVGLALDVLDRLAGLAVGESLSVPRFDKGRDTRLPPSRWPQVTGPVALIVFEGWCLAAEPQRDIDLVEPINALEREQDPDGRWRRYCNQALAGYRPLWRRFDRLLYLRPPGFEVVLEWRWQQEQALHARGAPRAMTRADVERFVHAFERISRAMMDTLPGRADLTLTLNAQRLPIAQSGPAVLSSRAE